MNPTIQQQWIAALPSYTQAMGALREGNTFCVLGVLCDLHSQAMGYAWTVRLTHYDEEEWSYLHSVGTVPHTVLQWAQLVEQDILPLQDANDAGAPFHELARRIKAL